MWTKQRRDYSRSVKMRAVKKGEKAKMRTVEELMCCKQDKGKENNEEKLKGERKKSETEFSLWKREGKKVGKGKRRSVKPQTKGGGNRSGMTNKTIKRKKKDKLTGGRKQGAKTGVSHCPLGC